MSDHCVHSHRTYYLLHFNFRAASRTVTFEMGPSILIFCNALCLTVGFFIDKNSRCGLNSASLFHRAFILLEKVYSPSTFTEADNMSLVPLFKVSMLIPVRSPRIMLRTHNIGAKRSVHPPRLC